MTGQVLELPKPCAVAGRLWVMLNDDVPTRLVSVTEAATVMRRSVETIRRRLRSGTLPGRRDANGTGREIWSLPDDPKCQGGQPPDPLGILGPLGMDAVHPVEEHQTPDDDQTPDPITVDW